MADLYVIGGGPAGLAAAIAARLRGLNVTLADRARPPIDKACGEGLLPDGVAAARSFGVALDAHPFSGICFRDGALGAEASFPCAPGLAMRRTDLHRAMVDRANELGVRLMWGARVTGLEDFRAHWIVGADGENSSVRRWAGLNDVRGETRRRFGFRRRYAVPPWSDKVEIVWGDRFQLYITPVACDEVSLALLCDSPRLRLDDTLAQFPELARRLGPPAGAVRGAPTASRRLRRVSGGRVALVGDASGSVDAITGEGLSLAFRQAEALAGALEAEDLGRYSVAHRRLSRRPRALAELLLLLGRRRGLRRAVIRAFVSHPHWFARLLAAHPGARPLPDLV